MLTYSALPDGRLTALGATRDFCHGPPGTTLHRRTCCAAFYGASSCHGLLALVVLSTLAWAAVQESETGRFPDLPPGRPPAVDVPDAGAANEAGMKPYRERVVGIGVEGSELRFDMAPIPGGEFVMGSPESEAGRGKLEAPRRRVRIGPFWMAAHETTWNLYRVFMFAMDRGGEDAAAPWADAVSRPSPPYRPMDFGMGVEGFPAISMTQFAARQFTRWLSMKTGRFYRLPTEAEWEYACRAGSRTAWSFGDDASELNRVAWHAGNSGGRYRRVAQLEPNAWGLFDLHGNVAEWTLDAYAEYPTPDTSEPPTDPIAWPTSEFPRSVRGGSWQDEPADLRCASRRGSTLSWKRMDPQIPQSVWYHTNARFLGFRVVRPLVAPAPEEQERYWAPDVDSVRRIVERQRRGERD